MSQLFDRAPQFSAEFFERERTLMQRLAEQGQAPETLFITCSDSRVVPEFIMGARPGDLFVLRNLANIVPPYGTGETGSGAAIEYAVRHLRVSHIVVCGHYDCGGVRAMEAGVDMAADPSITRWLEWARPAQTHTEALNITDPVARHQKIVQTNVLYQLANLQSYRCVQEALQADRLELHGWVFDISSGQIWSYRPASETFVLLESGLDHDPTGEVDAPAG